MLLFIPLVVVVVLNIVPYFKNWFREEFEIRSLPQHYGLESAGGERIPVFRVRSRA